MAAIAIFGYQNWMILAILNLYVTPMPPIKFRLNLTYGLGGDVWRISRWPSWISERNVLAILNFYVTVMPPIKFRLNPTCGLVGDVVWRISRWRHNGHLGYRNGMILAILNLHVATMPPTKFRLNPAFGSGMSKMWNLRRMTDDGQQAMT